VSLNKAEPLDQTGVDLEERALAAGAVTRDAVGLDVLLRVADALDRVLHGLGLGRVEDGVVEGHQPGQRVAQVLAALSLI